MVNYSNGKIYKIIDLTNDNVYIGSTTKERLCQRLSGHKASYDRYVSGKDKRKCSSFEILKNDNYKIELIELFPCNSKDELNAREGYWQREITCINHNIAGRTKEQYKEEVDYLKYHREYNMKYFEENKTSLSAKVKCECGSNYANYHKSRHMKTKKHINFFASQSE